MANIEKKSHEMIKRQFDEVLTLIQTAHAKVMYVANTTMLELYWSIGAYISSKIVQSQWGDSVVKELADYLATNAPESKGFSAQNLWRMKQFYETYCNADEKLAPLVREISWTKCIVMPLFTKASSQGE